MATTKDTDAVRGPAAAALVHPEAEGTGLIPTQILSDELAAEQTGDGMPVDVSRIPEDSWGDDSPGKAPSPPST